jgi:hypothetical protein
MGKVREEARQTAADLRQALTESGVRDRASPILLRAFLLLDKFEFAADKNIDALIPAKILPFKGQWAVSPLTSRADKMVGYKGFANVCSAAVSPNSRSLSNSLLAAQDPDFPVLTVQ